MASIVITEAELLDALAEAARGVEPSEARTGPELMAATGFPEKRLRAALKALQAQGRLDVHQVTRQSLDGRAIRVPAYTVRAA